MTPRIELLGELKLVGLRMTMSISSNKTRELWQNFQQRRKDVPNTVGKNLYSIQLYDDQYFKTFNPHSTFEKLAAIEVTNFNAVPPDMEAFILSLWIICSFLTQGCGCNRPGNVQLYFLNLAPRFRIQS